MATTEFISRPPLSRIKWTDAVLWRKRHKQFDRIQPTFQGMEPNHPTLSALIKLHADLGGQIFENRKRAEKLAEDMKHVEAVIRMFAPSFDVRKISMKRRYKSNPWFKRGTLFRHALNVLRTSAKPLTAREIAEAMIVAAGATPEPKAVRDLIGGVNASLQNNSGKVVEKVGEGMPARWKLI